MAVIMCEPGINELSRSEKERKGPYHHLTFLNSFFENGKEKGRLRAPPLSPHSHDFFKIANASS